MLTSTHAWESPGIKWVKGPHGWEEDMVQSEVIAQSIEMSQVRKVIELFLRNKRQRSFKHLYSCLSAAPVSKCSVKESVAWLQVSSQGSKECHGYSTLGELLRRLHLTNAVWQQGRFHYVMCLTELLVEKKFYSLSGGSRKHLFSVIDTLVGRVIATHERIRQMKKIVWGVMRNMLKYQVSYIGAKQIWYSEIERIRDWMKRLSLLTIVPRVDLSITLTDLPIEVQRIIVKSLDDHRDVESLAHVNQTFQGLCDEPSVWRNLCLHHFSKKELAECEDVLEGRRRKRSSSGKSQKLNITWKVKYHFMLKRFEKVEEFADPLMLCTRCRIIFWQDSGHPCIGDSANSVHEKITPKKLISFL